MKIALVNPPFIFAQRFSFTTSQCMGLRYISSVLKAAECEVVFIDALMLGFDRVREYGTGFTVGLDAQGIVDRVPTDCDYVAVSAPFSELAPVVHDMAAALKEQRPGATVILGGVYPSTQPDLAATSQADYFVVGEGERAMEQLARGARPEDVAGIYPTSEAKKPYPPADIVTDLDSLPFPDCDLPGLDTYFNRSQRLGRGRIASVITSRGCPYDCEFCSVHPVSGYKWRRRSAGNVIEEIRFLSRRHGIHEIEFEDDNLTLDPDRAAMIFEGIIRLNEEGACLSWSGHNGLRIDTLDERLIELAKRSNCRAITLALEHGDPEMLSIMNKRLDLDCATRVAEWAVKYRIPRINVFVLVGYPGETGDRFMTGVSYIKRLHQICGRRLNVVANIAQPYPGTRLLKKCLETGQIGDPNCGNFLVTRGTMSTANTVSIQTEDFDYHEVLRRKALLERWTATSPWKHFAKMLLPSPAIRLLNRLRGIRPPRATRP